MCASLCIAYPYAIRFELVNVYVCMPLTIERTARKLHTENI